MCITCDGISIISIGLMLLENMGYYTTFIKLARDTTIGSF